MMGQDSKSPSTHGLIQTTETVTAQQQPSQLDPQHFGQMAPPVSSAGAATVEGAGQGHFPLQREAAAGAGLGHFPLQPPPMPGGRGREGVVMGTTGLGAGEPLDTTIRGTFELSGPAAVQFMPPHGQMLPVESLFVPGLGPRGSISAPLSPTQGVHHVYPSSSSQYTPRPASVPIPHTSPYSSSTSTPEHQPASTAAPSRTAAHSNRPHIPNIIIEQVTARDSFGHSRTPPFILSQFSQWQLDIPGAGGNGRKNRTNSDSALYDVEKEQQQQHRSRASSQTGARAMMPVLSPSLSSERLHLEHIRIADSPTKDSHHSTYHFPSSHPFHPMATSFPPRLPLHRGEEEEVSAQQPGVARQVSQGFVVQERRPGETAMETDSGDLDRPTEVKTENVLLNLRYSQPGATGQEDAFRLRAEQGILTEAGSEIESETAYTQETSDKPKVPFLWKFQPEKQSLSQSPKTFWLRRHSDSNLPTQPQNLTVSHEQRSHSTGESGERLLRHHGDSASEEADPQKTRTDSTGESFRSSLSESTEATDYRTDPNWSAKRMKLKKTLLKRYQLQSEESTGSAQHSLESDDVFSPSPGIFSSRTFSFSPERIHSLQEAEKHPPPSAATSPSRKEADTRTVPPRTEAGSVSTGRHSGFPHQSPVDLSMAVSGGIPTETRGHHPTSQSSQGMSAGTTAPAASYVLSSSSKAVGKAGKPVHPLYVKTEMLSSSSSGGDQEESGVGGAPETPVFFSPSMYSPKSYYDSPRQQTGSVFQFHSPSHSRSPSLEKASDTAGVGSPLRPAGYNRSSLSDTPVGVTSSSPRAGSSRSSPFLHSPSPLSQEPQQKQQQARPPFHRSPSPLSQEQPGPGGGTAGVTLAPAQGTHSSQVSKKAALLRDISAYSGGSIEGSGDGLSKLPAGRILHPHSPRDTSQAPAGPYIMPTIKEHSQPQGSINPLATTFPVDTPDSLSPAASHELLSASAPSGFLSQTFCHLPTATSRGESTGFPAGGELLKAPPQGPLEAMLRHPSFSLSQLPTSGMGVAVPPTPAAKHTVPPGSIAGIVPREGDHSLVGGPFDVKPPVMQHQQQSTRVHHEPMSSSSVPPFESYRGELMKSEVSAATGGFQWGSMPLGGSEAPSPATSIKKSDTSGGKSGDAASKIIYCPFSEKVQEQRYQQEPHHNFVCPVCGQMFPSFNYLANHMVNHLPSETITKGPGDGNKIHICKVCNKSFSRSDMLTRHMRLHTGLRPYECRICGQVFSRSDHLHTHMRTHTGEKPYRCPQCPYAAPRRDMITRHMRIHMKQQQHKRGGRRNSSTGSADTQQSSFSSQESADSSEQKGRRNQSLSSLESMSLDSPLELPAFRRSASDFPPESPDAPSHLRHWSLESGASSDILPSPSTPGLSGLGSAFSQHWGDVLTKKRSWSATSMEVDPTPPPTEGKEKTFLGETREKSNRQGLIPEGVTTISRDDPESQDTDSTVVASGGTTSSSCETSPDAQQRNVIVIAPQQQYVSPGEYRISIMKTEPTPGDHMTSSGVPSSSSFGEYGGSSSTTTSGTRVFLHSEAAAEGGQNRGQALDQSHGDQSSSSQKEAAEQMQETGTSPPSSS